MHSNYASNYCVRKFAHVHHNFMIDFIHDFVIVVTFTNSLISILPKEAQLKDKYSHSANVKNCIHRMFLQSIHHSNEFSNESVKILSHLQLISFMKELFTIRYAEIIGTISQLKLKEKKLFFFRDRTSEQQKMVKLLNSCIFVLKLSYIALHL